MYGLEKVSQDFNGMPATSMLRKLAVSDEYLHGVSGESPIASRIVQHGGYGALGGAALGGLAGLGAGLYTGKLSPLLVAGGAGLGGLYGGLVGMGTGALHGSYDAGLVHGIKGHNDPSFADSDRPTLRSALVGGPAGAGLSELGKSHGSDMNASSALRALGK